jgi:glycosyltransferase involved in cell wall biosynthesis
MSSVAIIIPCYNEGSRLPVSGFIDFLKDHPSWEFLFVNDGSRDNTAGLIDDMKKMLPGQVTGIHLKSNQGKAAAVREGILSCLNGHDQPPAFIGYLDADLSAGPDQIANIHQTVLDNQLDYAFGSRIKKLNASIRRSYFRHLAGRFVTTIIDDHFRLGIYDTQCGCKLFSAGLAEKITTEVFITKWLFDVEIFLRIREVSPTSRGEEIGLLAWNSRKGSKIGPSNFLSIIGEIIRLFRNYPRKPNRK